MEKFPLLFSLEKDKNCKVGDRGREVNGETVWSWNWRRNVISGQPFQELQDLLNQIQGMSISQEEDKWNWLEEDNGKYSSKSLRGTEEFRWTRLSVPLALVK
ncbi:hypothetical protein QVD17_19928 [Tagetes erecta]|uniref:Uncharacterized protein n=1 Tax=Tagetes erecta TaxID=13708 RepID=A0AAD8KKC1_TARER|nr:hypothetical protein QVD17_19928 [Tagetes erecta]